MVCWQFLYYSKGLDDLAPDFDLCPTVCGDALSQGLKKIKKSALCADCPKREAKEKFLENCEHFLNEQVGERWKRYGLNNLYQAVLQTLDLEGLGESSLTLTASRMLNILDSERAKMRRINEWNEKQKQPK